MIVVAPAEADQADAIVALAEEMDRFYGATETPPRALRLRQVNDAIFSEQPFAHVLLAWASEQLVGFATYSFLWPAVGLTRSLFLKELYVAEAARRSGVGERLMREIFKVAVKHDCSRVEWHTETTNEGARAFYAKLGAPELEGKVFYRMEDDLVRRVSNDDS